MIKPRSLPFAHILDTLSIVSLVLLLTFAALPLYSAQIPEEAAQPAVADSQELQADYTVVLDAGHGGVDGGAVGTKTGVAEAGLNLAMVKLVQAGLEDRGVCVLLTRTDENALAKGKKADMQARKKVMNQPGVDIVVSIHMNKFTDASVKGPMAFYMKGSEEGRRLAETVIAAVCEAVESPVRKANPADYFMIRESPLPSVLVECGFLSNASDELLLQDPQYQRTLAGGVVTGVMRYLESRPASQEGVPAPSASATPQVTPK